jgi:hypothetical protein
MHCAISLTNQKQSVVSRRVLAICCVHGLCSLAYCFSHCAFDFGFYFFVFSGDSCASFGFWLLSWMPRLPNNNLASCFGTDVIPSDVISSASTSLASAGLVPSSSGLVPSSSLLPVVLPSVSLTSSALPSPVMIRLWTTSWSTSLPLASPRF